jgi:orotidine-5'-phosphate decarboxylase
VTQKGKIDAFAKVAGHYFHPIVGSAIYESASPQEQTRKMVADLGLDTVEQGSSCMI